MSATRFIGGGGVLLVFMALLFNARAAEKEGAGGPPQKGHETFRTILYVQPQHAIFDASEFVADTLIQASTVSQGKELAIVFWPDQTVPNLRVFQGAAMQKMSRENWTNEFQHRAEIADAKWFAVGLETCERLMSKDSILIVIGQDMTSLTGGEKAALRALSRKHTVHVVSYDDHSPKDLPDLANGYVTQVNKGHLAHPE